MNTEKQIPGVRAWKRKAGRVNIGGADCGILAVLTSRVRRRDPRHHREIEASRSRLLIVAGIVKYSDISDSAHGGGQSRRLKVENHLATAGGCAQKGRLHLGVAVLRSAGTRYSGRLGSIERYGT